MHANLDIFAELPAAANPGKTLAEHNAWLAQLSHEQRLAAIRRFRHNDAGMSHDDIVFALRRGESLHIRANTGEWLLSYSWTLTDTLGYQPCEHDWVTGASCLCALTDIPAVGPLHFRGEACTAVFYRIGDAPLWRKPAHP